MKFCGEDEDIDINYTGHPEFKEWRWQGIDSLVASAISFKRSL